MRDPFDGNVAADFEIPPSNAPREKISENVGPSPSGSSAARVESVRSPSGVHPVADELRPDIEDSALLEYTEQGGTRRIIESQAAEIVAAALRGRLAWDAPAGQWLSWASSHWRTLDNPAEAERLLAEAVHTGCEPLGFRTNYLNGVTQLIQRLRLLPPPKAEAGAVPFGNGLLRIATGKLIKATPDNAPTWALPWAYDASADCPSIKDWLLRATGDKETVELLRAWIGALLRGLPLQKFLVLRGRGGTGKGTFQRLVMAVAGSSNVAISTLRDLECNRFETAKLYGKRLCMINEAGRHGGDINMLKAVTGGDALPLERKHQQQTGSFTFDGLVLMATNEDLQTTDSTSGLERRRVVVRFSTTATAAERADWAARGGEEAVLHPEVPGLINWALELSPAQIRERFEHLPAQVAEANFLGMAAGNSVADWLLESTTPAPGYLAQVGVRREKHDRDTGESYYERADQWLYANYLTHCQEHGRSRPVAANKFSEIVVDLAETLGHEAGKLRHPDTRAACIQGVALLSASDVPERGAWLPERPETGRTPDAPDGDRMDSGRTQPAQRMNRMDGRPNSPPKNCEGRTEGEI